MTNTLNILDVAMNELIIRRNRMKNKEDGINAIIGVTGNVVNMVVVSMPEEVRGEGVFYKGKEMSIASVNRPDLRSDRVYINGMAKSKDLVTVTHSCKTGTLALEYALKVRRLINSYNETKVEAVEEMTVAEISKALGKEVKVVK